MFERYADVALGLTDATSAAVARRAGVNRGVRVRSALPGSRLRRAAGVARLTAFPRSPRGAASRASAGRYQFQRPSSFIDGRDEDRADRSSRRGRARRRGRSPSAGTSRARPAAKPLKTATMISAAPVISRAVERDPERDRLGVVAGLVEALADPREQEDVVVHREAEEDGEQEQRQPGLDRRRPAGSRSRSAPVALLEDEHEQAVGGADREQVERDRLRRNDDRAERDREQDEAAARARTRTRSAGSGRSTSKKSMFCGRHAADEDLGVDARERRRDRGRRGGRARRRRPRRAFGSPASGTETSARSPASFDLERRRPEAGSPRERRLEPIDRRRDLGRAGVAVDDDLDRGDPPGLGTRGRARRSLLRGQVVGKRADAGRARLRAERPAIVAASSTPAERQQAEHRAGASPPRRSPPRSVPRAARRRAAAAARTGSAAR